MRRRTLLLGSVALAATGCGRDDPSHSVPAGTSEQYVSGSVRSAAMQTVVGWTVAYPGSPAPLPVFLYLHGRGGGHRDIRRYGPFLADHVRRGGTPFALVGVDGGNHTYYHRRSTGEDPQRMILSELLPLLRSRGLQTDRTAIGGVSMGGYGALLLAESAPERFAACVVDSPAVFASAKDRSKGSFDSDADFRAHDVVAGASRLTMPLRVTCGLSDPFLPGVRRLLARRPGAESDISRGGHDKAFWLHTAPAQIAFAGSHL